MKWLVLFLIMIPLAHAKTTIYPPSVSEQLDWRERLTFPHIFPGQTIVSSDRFLEDPLRPGSSTVRWTSEGSYSINLDKIHVLRRDFVLVVKSKKGPSIRILPWETTKLYLAPEYYKIRYDRQTQTVWLAKYSD